MSFYDHLLKWAEKVCAKDEKEAQQKSNQYVYEALRDDSKERASNGETCKNCKFCEVKFKWGFTFDKYYCTKHNIDLENDDTGYYVVQDYDRRYKAQSCSEYKYSWTNDHDGR